MNAWVWGALDKEENMARAEAQSYQNHRRYVPMFHFGLTLLLVINLFWAGWWAIKEPSAETAIALVTALALVLLFYYTRMFPLHVQDRLIRLEERLRLARVLPQELAERLDELTPSQLIALRFAADGELSELVPRVLAGELRGREEIKRAIRDWRPDHYRC